MPIYEYICKTCGEKFEEIRPHQSADDKLLCLYCHSSSTKRILSTFNAKSSGSTLSNSNSGCTGCGGGNCASCHSE